MEVVAIVDIFAFGWVKIIFQLSEVGLAELSLALGGERVFDRVLETFFVLLVDSLRGCFGQALSV